MKQTTTKVSKKEVKNDNVDYKTLYEQSLIEKQQLEQKLASNKSKYKKIENDIFKNSEKTAFVKTENLSETKSFFLQNHYEFAKANFQDMNSKEFHEKLLSLMRDA